MVNYTEEMNEIGLGIKYPINWQNYAYMIRMHTNRICIHGLEQAWIKLYRSCEVFMMSAIFSPCLIHVEQMCAGT